ncbi:hypothetical protein FB451DRAFT_990262, partial [Mycena latifolia]
WKSVHLLRAALNATTNVFSVLAGATINPGAPAPGLLASVHLTYTDNTTDSFVSDTSWRVTADIPTDFPLPLETTAFTTAAVLAPYGSGPWGNDATLASPDPAPLNLSASAWLWSNPNASTVSVPVGNTGFRKVMSAPIGKIATSAQVLLTVDNSFDLFVNGRFVGSPPYDSIVPGVVPAWNYAQLFTAGLDAETNVFVVIAKKIANPDVPDGPSPPGFIATIRIFYADNSSDVIGTDATWLTGDVTDTATFLSVADAELAPSTAQGPFGMAPWGQLLGVSDA